MTDIGWQYMPGAIPGEVFIPVSPRAALVIRGDGRSYEAGVEQSDVPVVTWKAEEVARPCGATG